MMHKGQQLKTQALSLVCTWKGLSTSLLLVFIFTWSYTLIYPLNTAALAYGLEQIKGGEPTNIMIFDLGIE